MASLDSKPWRVTALARDLRSSQTQVQILLATDDGVLEQLLDLMGRFEAKARHTGQKLLLHPPEAQVVQDSIGLQVVHKRY